MPSRNDAVRISPVNKNGGCIFGCLLKIESVVLPPNAIQPFILEASVYPAAQHEIIESHRSSDVDQRGFIRVGSHPEKMGPLEGKRVAVIVYRNVILAAAAPWPKSNPFIRSRI